VAKNEQENYSKKWQKNEQKLVSEKKVPKKVPKKAPIEQFFYKKFFEISVRKIFEIPKISKNFL